jgi:oligopeptide transport system substrate-binding protein
MSRWRWLTAPAVVALAVGMTACGSSSGSSTTNNSFSVAETEPDHLNPGQATGAYDEVHALFAPLAEVDQHGKLVMVQAQSITSTDNLTWTVKIKPGWTFHNGEKVTAQSYADGWNATAYGPNGWGNNGELANIEGYPALNPAKGKPTTKTLSGVTVLNPTTLQVKLIKADSQFPLELTAGQPAFEPMPKAAFKHLKAYDQAPIGDGPYEMVGTWKHNVSVTVKRYAKYPGTKPKADQIVFKLYSDLHTAYTDAQGGNVDIVSVPQDKYGQVKNDFPGAWTAYNAPALDYIGFPLYDKRYSDIRIREAISLAIDRNALNKAIFGGLYQPATGVVPPAELGAKTGLCQYCSFNPTKAKQLLAQAGGWSGPMQIWYPAGVGYDQTFNAIANQIRQNLGIKDVKLKGLPGFVQYSQDQADKKVDGPYRGHWGALYPSMQNTLTALFTATGDGHTESWYSSAKVDSLLAQANAANGSTATDFYNQAQEQVLKDFPVVPLFYAKYVYAHSKNVSNVIIDVNQIELGQVTPK